MTSSDERGLVPKIEFSRKTYVKIEKMFLWVCWVAESEFYFKSAKFQVAEWRTEDSKYVQYSDFFDKMLYKGGFWVAESEFKVKFATCKIAECRTKNFKNIQCSYFFHKMPTKSVCWVDESKF